MKNVFLYSWLLCAVTICSYGQFVPNLQNNNWVFGTRNSLRYIAPGSDPTAIVPVPGSMPTSILVGPSAERSFALEGCASVSDRLGNLLFYTNGVSVYDRSDNLITNQLIGNVSSAQNVIIIPQPNSNMKFYIVTTYGRTIATGSDIQNRGLYYSEIDLEQPIANMMTRLNVPLQDMNGIPIDGSVNANNDNTSESLTSVLHSDGVNYWLVVHINSIIPGQSPNRHENIYSYLVTQFGIGPIAEAVTPITSFPNLGVGVCTKISPDMTKLAITTRDSGVYLGTFDNDNGNVSISPNRITRPDGIFRCFGVEFSRNSEVLYYTATWQPGSSSVSQNILSRVNLSTSIEVINNTAFWGIQRGLDDRIYLCNREIGANSVISVIDNPNNLVNNPIITSTLTMNFKVNNALPQWVWKQSCEQTLTDDADIPPGFFDVNEQRSQTIFLTNTISGPAAPLNATRSVYHAGNFIEMLPENGSNLGFEAQYGSEFVAYIAPCGSGFAYRNSNTDANPNQSTEKANVLSVSSKLQIYPNPSNTFVTIALDSSKLKSIVIASLDGKVILNQNVNTNSEQIDVSNYSKGLYLITVQTEDGKSIIKKFIKN